MAKILFVYPNKEGYPIIPLGISILSGILKNHGHKVSLFDVTFMVPERLDHNAREKTGVVKKVDVESYWGKTASTDINGEFKKKIGSFNPDLIAFSIVENNYGMAKELFKLARQSSKSLIIVGGIFPTVAPEFFMGEQNVDIICIGEGEYPILELVDKLDSKQEISKIPNLIVKIKQKITKSNLAKFYDWQPFICQDWQDFDGRHILKPFCGRMWRAGFFEMSRGCPYGCSYCANYTYQQIFKSLKGYHREKPIEYVIAEIREKKNSYSLEIVFFNDESFLLMNDKRFEEFCRKYKKNINLPFFIQTRAETLLEEKRVRMLKDAGCITIGIGVESGNEKIRKKVLNKNTADEIFIKAFRNCNKYNIRTTAYVMIGLPFETEQDIIATANFCRRLDAQSIAISIFAPYHGSKLYNLCTRQGLIDDRYYENISVNYSSILKMPQITNERLEELYYKFNDLVFEDKEVFINAS